MKGFADSGVVDCHDFDNLGINCVDDFSQRIGLPVISGETYIDVQIKDIATFSLFFVNYFSCNPGKVVLEVFLKRIMGGYRLRQKWRTTC
jgi:hypothetical protein